MKLGVMSDSHGRVHRVQEAIRILEAAGAEAFVHCGDVGGPEVLEEFVGRRCWFVWGNTDFPDATWRPLVDALGLPWPNGRAEFQIAGRRIAVFHGHERGFQEAAGSGDYDYVLYGHTHCRDDIRLGRTRLVNPGALHRTRTPTVALIDLARDEVRFLPVETTIV